MSKERALTKRQRLALSGVERGFVSAYSMGSMSSLVKRGLVDDWGRYHASRGHTRRHVITAKGREALR